MTDADGWQARVDAVWADADALGDQGVIDAIDALAAERPDGDALALFERGRAGWHDYVMFTLDAGVRTALLAVETEPDVESTQGGTGVVYWTVERGHTLGSTVGKAMGAAKYKPHLTTRNVNTLDKLLK
jgi:hypothetical protein